MRMIYFSASLYALSWEAWRWRILNIMYCNFMNKQWAYTQSFSNLIQEQSFCKWRSMSIGQAWLWLFSVTIGEITTIPGALLAPWKWLQLLRLHTASCLGDTHTHYIVFVSNIENDFCRESGLHEDSMSNVADQFTEEQIQEMKEAFNMFDRNRFFFL